MIADFIRGAEFAEINVFERCCLTKCVIPDDAQCGRQRHALDRCVEECTRNGCYALRHNDVFLFPVISDKHAVAQRDEAGVIIYQMITESCVQERIRTDVLHGGRNFDFFQICAACESIRANGFCPSSEDDSVQTFVAPERSVADVQQTVGQNELLHAQRSVKGLLSDYLNTFFESDAFDAGVAECLVLNAAHAGWYRDLVPFHCTFIE